MFRKCFLQFLTLSECYRETFTEQDTKLFELEEANCRIKELEDARAEYSKNMQELRDDCVNLAQTVKEVSIR